MTPDDIDVMRDDLILDGDDSTLKLISHGSVMLRVLVRHVQVVL